MSNSKMITIKAPEHDVPVESWDCSVEGLVITAVPVTEMDEGYRVTHESSGRAVTPQPFASIPIARLFASRIDQFLSEQNLTWQSSRDEMTGLGEDFMEELRSRLNKEAASLIGELEANPASIIQQSIAFEDNN